MPYSSWSGLGLLLVVGLLACRSARPDTPITAAQWEKVTLDFRGPATAETATENPFTYYRLEVTFRHADTSFTLPGFYAADGRAAHTGADTGSVWRVHFRPPLMGEWTYDASLYHGPDIVYAEPPPAAARLPLSQGRGTVRVGPPAEGERGRLVRTHPRYLQWTQSGEYFLKGGADSPENLLAYQDFDGTYRHSNNFRDGESRTEGLHHYTAHLRDWRPGDPTWQDGKGKGLIGGLNYLAAKGVNSVYFLTMNIGGDGKDVWPYIAHDELTRFDCSKLDQWEIVFDHMDDQLGMMLHIVTQETENETLLDSGDTGPQRRLYYRELLARFGHHRALTWNLGEENGPNSWSQNAQTHAQQAAAAAWFGRNDPYQHYVVFHTHPSQEETLELYEPLLGNTDIDGLSLQLGNPYTAHEATLGWLQRTRDAGAPWMMTVDEIGPWWRGIDHDASSPHNNQDSVRALTLWGNLMAGGAGVEWYFGARNPHNDLGMEDWRSRDRVWDWTRHALVFFREYLPFDQMEAHDEWVAEGQYCLARPGEVYAVFLPFGGPATLDLSGYPGDYSVQWYDPRQGGGLQAGSISRVQGGTKVDLGAPPGVAAADWAVLVRRIGSAR